MPYAFPTANVFDEEGDGYNYASAIAAGMKPKGTGVNMGHWGSVTETTQAQQKEYDLPTNSFLMLKGRTHPTWNKAVQAEEARGFTVKKIGDRYFSVPANVPPVTDRRKYLTTLIGDSQVRPPLIETPIMPKANLDARIFPYNSNLNDASINENQKTTMQQKRKIKMHGELDKQKAIARYIQMMQGARNAPTSMSFGDGGEVGEGIASLRPSETSMGLAPYGVRHSGEGLKGKGYFGEIQSPSGQSVTEYSLYDEDIGEYPSIVPTLTAEELQDTIRRSSQGEQPSEEVIMKARMYAKDRLSNGESTFSGPTELRFPVPSKPDMPLMPSMPAMPATGITAQQPMQPPTQPTQPTQSEAELLTPTDRRNLQRRMRLQNMMR